MCDDARQADYSRLMAGGRAAMVFTVPPYNVRIPQVVGRGRIKHRDFANASGELSPAEFTDFLTKSLIRCVEYSQDGALHFVFMDWRHMRELLDAGSRLYTEMKNLIVWTKTNAGQGSFYRSAHE